MITIKNVHIPGWLEKFAKSQKPKKIQLAYKQVLYSAENISPHSIHIHRNEQKAILAIIIICLSYIFVWHQDNLDEQQVKGLIKVRGYKPFDRIILN